MIKQFSHLSFETDGRYATDAELRFIEEYIDSVETRISAYKKVHDAAKEIIDEVEVRQEKVQPKLFYMGSRKTADICKRDMTDIFCSTAATMLFNDLDRLRDGIILWYKTIVEAFGYIPSTQVSYQVLEEVTLEHLTPEEAELMQPFLRLNHTILSS